MNHREQKYSKLGVVVFALLSSLALVSCGSDDTTTATPVTPTPVTPTPVGSVPGAPTIGAVTAGNASASVAFTAPSSTGSSAITGYTATCTSATATSSASGAASPIGVAGLANGTVYGCSVTATNSVGTSAASSPVSVTPVLTTPTPTGTTAGVLCNYSYSALNSSASVNLTSTAAWTCNATSRVLSANGIPDHAVGTFPNSNNPNTISAQTVAATYTLTPTQTTTATTLGGPRGAVGYVLNGVKIDPSTAGTCNDGGTTCSAAGNVGQWSIEALGQSSFNFGTDSNNAHVQPTGEYHYHGMPEGFISKLGGGSTKMTLIAWAADGFPIYARYGYSAANDASSALKVIKGSYRLKATPNTSRPATTLYAMGVFQQDYEYAAGSGDLDECNGRTGVTPEFPSGIYHYYATDSYPFLQRCVKGAVTTTGGMPPPQ
jgi:hypothetical protein